MSRDAGMLVLQVVGNNFSLVLADARAEIIRLSHACSFVADRKSEDASPLRDENALDALAEYVSQNEWTGRELICILGGSSVACHYYDVPPLKGPALRQAVLLKLSQQLHFEVEDAVVALGPDASGPTKDGRQMRVAVIAVHKAHARAAVDAAARAGLKIKTIAALPTTIAALAQGLVPPAGGLRSVLHIDEQTSTLIVFNGSSVCVASELPIGGQDLTKALMRPIIAGEEVIQLDEVEAANLRNEVGIPAADQPIESLGINGDRVLPLLEPALQQFAKHLIQWLTFATTGAGGQPVQELSVVGPGAAVKGLAETLGRRLSLKVQAKDWLKGTATLQSQGPGPSLEAFAPAVSAVRYWSTLPDLTPPEVLRDRRLARVQRRFSIFCATAAAAVAGMALMFDQVASDTQPVVNLGQMQLADVQQIVAVNNQWAVEQQAVAALEQEFDDFNRASPLWIGVFKELSVLLPREVQATGFEVRGTERGLQLVVNGAVYATGKDRGFDDAVEQTLRLLQRSAFFERVRLLAANGTVTKDHPGAVGTFSVEVALVYSRARS